MAKILCSLGSPPHMRGKAWKAHDGPPDFGITPAHAGKSRARIECAVIVWDHPRTCGEKLPWLTVNGNQYGSPPHMRGKVVMVPLSSLLVGITPAHAGKSAQIFRPCGEQWDHPRTCGEKDYEIYTILRESGSPPHMRGKVLLLCVLRWFAGITPAHAGKSRSAI